MQTSQLMLVGRWKMAAGILLSKILGAINVSLRKHLREYKSGANETGIIIMCKMRRAYKV